MKKIVIQIPCFNEEAHIGDCLSVLPRRIPGFDTVEILVVDDGSADGTLERARRGGAHHVLALGSHMGLARAFVQGIHHAIMHLSADVVVNYDADRQYSAEDIGLLLEPILSGQADYVLGQRPIAAIEHFSPLKKVLQKMGSLFVSLLSGARIKDVTTGFRALNREAGLKLSVWTSYTYTLETLLHAVELNLKMVEVPVRVNEKVLRPSRLIKTKWRYCWISVKTIVFSFVRYRPFETFSTLSSLAFILSLGIGLRFLWYFLLYGRGGKIQSLILCAILAMASFIFLLAAILGESISLNRRLLEQLRYELRLHSLGDRAPSPDVRISHGVK